MPAITWRPQAVVERRTDQDTWEITAAFSSYLVAYSWVTSRRDIMRCFRLRHISRGGWEYFSQGRQLENYTP